MRWRQGRRSENIEDRRGRRRRGGLQVGGLGLFLILIIGYLMGANPLRLLEVMNQMPSSTELRPGGTPPGTPANDEAADFVSVVLADTEDTWSQIFSQMGDRYQPPTLVLFTDSVESACGFNSAAVGPFYCPPDRQVYIDLGFFRELDERFGAPGDFAQAYVLAHEVGHHVQSLLGIADKVMSLRQRASELESNELSVRLELQADCLAGVWGHHAHRRGLLEPGDVEEGLRAAAAIGDDRIQRQTTGYVSPESWTHGSSEDRARWLRRGLEQGRAELCDTFQ